jgi:hypothetical protein
MRWGEGNAFIDDPYPPRLRPLSVEELTPENVSAWQGLRQERGTCHQQRILR